MKEEVFRIKVDAKLATAFISILEKKKISQQEYFNEVIKSYVIDNIDLLTKKAN